MKKKSTKITQILLFTISLLIISFIFVSQKTNKSNDSVYTNAQTKKYGVNIIANGSTRAQVSKPGQITSAIAESKLNNNDVLAPGSNGDMISIIISGTPETDLQIKHEVDFNIGKNWVDSEKNYYCPIIITIGENSYNGNNYTSALEFENAIKTAINNFSGNYNINTSTNDISTYSIPPIFWSWPYSTGSSNDIKDTYLGNQAYEGNEATISLIVTTTIS